MSDLNEENLKDFVSADSADESNNIVEQIETDSSVDVDTVVDTESEDSDELVIEYYSMLEPDVENENSFFGTIYEEPKKPSKFKSILNNCKTFLESICIDNLVMRAIAAFMAVSGYFYFQLVFKEGKSDFDSLQYVKQSNVKSVVFGIIVAFILFSVLKYLFERIKTDGYLMFLSTSVYVGLTLWKNDSFYYMLGAIFVLGIMLYYLLKNDALKELYDIKGITAFLLLLASAVVMCVFVGSLTIFRYWIYYGSTFDLGIAEQMYYYMLHTGLQSTTCERNELLSHFAVHFTPIYYLLVPVYAIYPHLETLLASQPVILALGAIPLYSMCRHLNFKRIETVCISFAYLFSCAIVAPCFYDFHENAFIPVMMLSFFCFLEKRKWIPMYIFMALTLACKEDVSVSVCCIGMYVLFTNLKDKTVRTHGVLITALSGIYFLFVTGMLAKYGEGTFSFRFNSLMADPDNGLIEIFRTALTDPAFMINMAFNEDKFQFFIQMFLPLAFLPFFNKKGGNLFLLVPTFLVCMLPDYPYQHDIDFQYVFGMIPMLFYLCVINGKELGAKFRKVVFPFMAMANIVLTFSHMTGKTNYAKYYYENDSQKIEVLEHYLSMIPEDASVEATHVLVPRLADRLEIYTFPDHVSEMKWDSTDFVVLKVGSISEEDKEHVQEKIEYMERNGYSYAFGDENYIAVYKLNSYEYPEGYGEN